MIRRVGVRGTRGGLAGGVTRHTGRDDRATVEQVLDPRTRMILFKLLNAGVIGSIHGCVSTGKEANVYHAFTPTGGELAIKVYKTSILVFKDRDRYVSGEFRFKSGYAKSNPRKMVKLWAEKEMRNLKRLGAAGLPVPTPRVLRMHVLVMDFLGADGVAAPRLKDAALSTPQAAAAYREVVTLMRRMYAECRLVHADLSEYNMLYHAGRVVLIDVSQSVETDHPRALEFLRMDATNVTDFFRRAGVDVMTPRELFDSVVSLELAADAAAAEAYVDAAVARAAARAACGGPAALSPAEEGEARVFMQSFIPQSLAGVRDVEGDVDRLTRGDTAGLYYAGLTGVVSAAGGGGGGTAGAAAEHAPPPDERGPAAAAAGGHHNDDSPAAAGGEAAAASAAATAVGTGVSSGSDGEGAAEAGGDDTGGGGEAAAKVGGGASDDDDDDDDSDGGEEEEGGGAAEGDPAYTKRAASKEERAAHKAAVKAAKREKRKTKIPKAVKKRHAKSGTQR